MTDDLDDVQEALLEVLEREERPVCTAVELADELDVSRPTATNLLYRLVARGSARTAKLGGVRLWWPADLSPAKTPKKTPAEPPADPDPSAGTETYSSAQTQADTPANTPAVTPAKEDGPRADGRDDQDDVDDEIEAVVLSVSSSWEDDPDRLEARRAAARAALQVALEADDPKGKSDLQDLHDEHPVSGQNYETWWRKNVRPVLSETGTYSQGSHGYRIDSL